MVTQPAAPQGPDERSADSSAGRKAFLLRLSPELHDQLRGWAAQEFRSLNGHIEYLLRKALAERDGTARRSR